MLSLTHNKNTRTQVLSPRKIFSSSCGGRSNSNGNQTPELPIFDSGISNLLLLHAIRRYELQRSTTDSSFGTWCSSVMFERWCSSVVFERGVRACCSSDFLMLSPECHICITHLYHKNITRTVTLKYYEYSITGTYASTACWMDTCREL